MSEAEGSEQTPNAGESESGNPETTQQATDWREDLSPESKEFAEVKGWQKPDEIVNGYANLEKLVGKDAVAIPTEYSKPEEIDAFWQKLGKPDSAEGYEFTAPEGYEAYSTDMADWFREFAFENHLPAPVAQRLHDTFVGRMIDGQGDAHTAWQAKATEWDTELRKDLGGDYDETVGRAQGAVRHFGSEALAKYFDETGLGNHPELVKAWSKAGELISEDDLRGGHDARSQASVGQARERLAEIRANAKHPANDRYHPDHDRAVAEMLELQETISGAEQPRAA